MPLFKLSKMNYFARRDAKNPSGKVLLRSHPRQRSVGIFHRKIKKPAIASQQQEGGSRKKEVTTLKEKDILNFPYLSEKATFLSQEGKYVFNVSPRANKTEIKNAVEKIYKVKVEKINIINLPAKRAKFRRQLNLKTKGANAIVTLTKGQKIDVGT